MTEIEMEICRTNRELSQKDFDIMIMNYNPEIHEAPIVLGHPKNDRPAYGWVKSLRRAGDRLYATVKLIPEMVDLINQGFYKKRSISFRLDTMSKTPILRHVGFLGATIPYIKGMADIQFDEEKTNFKNYSDEEKKLFISMGITASDIEKYGDMTEYSWL
jgi:hypothetical protein